MKRLPAFARTVTACLLGALVASNASAQGPAEPPAPDAPLQTKPSPVDDSWIHQGWKANILGISGNGKTLLVVNGEKGYVSSAEIDGTVAQKAHSSVENGPAVATFELADKDHRIVLKVKDPRGAEWSESVDVPRGMKVTVDIKANYVHRGYEGTIKNDRLTCKVAAQRKTLRFELWQGTEMIGNPITLDPGKSAPGVRLKEGTYDLRVHEKRGRDFVLLRHVTLDPKEPQWRHDEPCF
jgi:hypothetical protein